MDPATFLAANPAMQDMGALLKKAAAPADRVWQTIHARASAHHRRSIIDRAREQLRQRTGGGEEVSSADEAQPIEKAFRGYHGEKKDLLTGFLMQQLEKSQATISLLVQQRQDVRRPDADLEPPTPPPSEAEPEYARPQGFVWDFNYLLIAEYWEKGPRCEKTHKRAPPVKNWSKVSAWHRNLQSVNKTLSKKKLHTTWIYSLVRVLNNGRVDLEGLKDFARAFLGKETLDRECDIPSKKEVDRMIAENRVIPRQR